jgi:CheY-like chemotaxis protein
VDDDPVTLAHYARALEVEGFAVLTALDASRALEAVQQVRPEAAIVDLRMPAMDGLAFLRALAAQGGPPIPAALVTGDYLAEDTTLSEAFALTPRIVFKPLWVEDLVALVKSLVQQGAG